MLAFKGCIAGKSIKTFALSTEEERNLAIITPALYLSQTSLTGHWSNGRWIYG